MSLGINIARKVENIKKGSITLEQKARRLFLHYPETIQCLF